MQVELYWYFILCYIILSQLIMRLWSEFDKWSKIEILLSKHTSTYLFDPIIIHHLGTRRPAKLLHDGNRPLLKLYFKLYILGISYDNLWTFKSWPFGLLYAMRQTNHKMVWWLNWLSQLGMAQGGPGPQGTGNCHPYSGTAGRACAPSLGKTNITVRCAAAATIEIYFAKSR